jgi:hypothetical protein
MRKKFVMILCFLFLKTLLFSFSAFSFEKIAEKLKNIVADNHVMLEKKNSNTNPLGFFFVSDNQFNNIFGDPQVLRSKVADKVVVVAIRPPRLDLYAPDILEHTLRKQGKDKFVVHLGDATNIACWNEWNKFTNRMKPKMFGKKIHKGWVMVPGNHDFFFLGNTAGHHWSKRGGFKSMWAHACNDTEYPSKLPKNLKEVILTKGEFVKSYLNKLRDQGNIYRLKKDFPYTGKANCKNSKIATRFGLTEPSTKFKTCNWKSKDPNSFLQRLHYKLPLKDDVRVEYRALLVQEVALNPPGSKPYHYRGILMDTQDYHINPSIAINTFFGKISKYFGKVNPGENGAIQKRQGDIIKDWIKENNKIHKKENTIYVFMGHHPYDTLLYLSKARLNGIFNDLEYYMYVSSHTHFGWIKKHLTVSELNVGSVTDWGTLGGQTVYLNEARPMSASSKKGHVPDIKLPVFWKTNHLKKQPADIKAFCKPEWNASNDKTEKHGYLAYKKSGWLPSAAHDKTLDILIEAYRDMYDRLDLSKIGGKTKTSIDQDLKAMKDADKDLKKSCGMYKTKCRGRKFNMIKRLYDNDQLNYFTDEKYHDIRMKYGVCQAIWSSMKENETW